MSFKYFNVKHGLITGNITLDATNNSISSTNLTVYNSSNLGNISNVTITGGNSGYLLTTDGSGVLSWVAPNNNSSSNIANGNSNVSIATSGGNVTTSVGGNANVVIITSTGEIINGNLTVTNNLLANTVQLGSVGQPFCKIETYSATTVSTSANQVIWTGSSVVSSVDFKIIATNSSDNTRTTTNITTNILGATLYWSEYGRLHINNGIGNFSVALTSSAPYVAELKVTPNSANLIYYNILISSYTT